MPKNAEIFSCEKCNFICSKKSNYTAHLSTSKHLHRTLLNILEPKKCLTFSCVNCKKTYSARNSLWYHQKKCQKMPKEEVSDKEIINILIKQNTDFKNMILDVCKNVHTTPTCINSNNTINSNNKTFNLQVFLNETCKDAMNIMDFVNSLQLQLSDLETVGKLGYVDGISNIIVKNLKALEIHKRPVHCSDSKREIIYVKDENKWEKDNEEKAKMKKAIKHVTDKNIKMISEWKEKFPDCIYSDSLKSDEYNKIIVESMGGPGNNLSSENKIIKRLAKEVIIEKDE